MLIEIYPVTYGAGIDARAMVDDEIAGTFLARFLASDIQGSFNTAHEVLAHLDAVRTGGEASWSQSGNAYIISANASEVVFDAHWANDGDIDTAAIPLEEVREALRAWIAALENRSISA